MKVLSDEFCSSLSDIIEKPTCKNECISDCGEACNLQEDNIVFEYTRNETVVNFELVINSIDNNSSSVQIRLKNIMDTISSDTKEGFIFTPGEIRGKHQIMYD